MQAQMKAFRPEDDPHKGQCGLCHNPHTQTTTVGAYQSCASSNCHARSDTLTAMHKGLTGRHKLETCGACHTPHTWKVGKTDCTSCHSGISDPAVQVRRPPQPARGTSMRPSRFMFASFARLPEVPFPERPPPPHPQARDSARFAHAQHRSVTCTTCHTSDVAHGSLKMTVARQCAACHHGNTAVGRACDRCHQPAELAAPRIVSVPVKLTVWPAPKPRQLSFEHQRHTRVACAECHDATALRSVVKTCASCHTDHHAASRTCASCHPPALALHSRTVHVTGCGDAGCHASEATPATTPVRSVCVACHVQQVDHKPGRDCAACHLSRWRTAAGGGGR
jgi:hypothetical protein